MATFAMRRSRVTRHGIEVPNGLTYHDWQPGGEYTKPLTLKNVHLKPQRIKFNISGSQFTSVVYPQPLVLSAGTSCTLPITFRPCEKNCYQEHIEIETSQGIFQIPIRAQLPKSDLALPDSLKLGMCAVQESVTVNFEVSNISKVPIHFSWDVPDGFEISPTSDSLSPKQTCKLTATFRPSSAIVYSDSAVCIFSSKLEAVGRPFNQGNDQVKRKFMKLEGIGKYPHIAVKLCSGKRATTITQSRSRANTLSETPVMINNTQTGEEAEAGKDSDDAAAVCSSGGETVVDFGEVAVGSVTKKRIEITNVSPVVSTFSITPLQFSPPSSAASAVASDSAPLFACSAYEGSLQPHASTKITLLYSPLIPTNHPSIGYFSIKVRGGLGSSVVKCLGQPKGPAVCLEDSVTNFGNVACGKMSTAVMHIRNNSDVSTVFQLQLDKCSVFQCDTPSGELGAHASQTITICFKPHKPIPYCRRIACLVQHQEPIFSFFIGTGYSETTRPAVLQPCHLKAYLSHARSGVSMLAPELLKQYIQEGKLTPEGPNKILLPSSPDLEIPPPHALITAHTSTYSHYLLAENEPSAVPHVSIDSEVLKFGYCVPNQLSESKLVSITNHTCGTVCCSWVTAASGSFAVMPDEQEILPGQTVPFSFSFKPGKWSQFYCREMECFVYYKSLGDYHHVDPDTVCPPWCITLTASGHSFDPSSEAFLPKFHFDSKNVVFPPTIPGQPAHRTAMITNTGDTPILYDITQDPTETFTIKPSHGLLFGKHQLFVLQMLPKEASVYKHIMPCSLNATDLHTQELLLSGSGDIPGILLDNEGQLFFRPTCIGTTSSAEYRLTNTSKLPLRYQWKLNNIESGLLKVVPQSGTIMPNEIQSHSWHFSPSAVKPYSLKAVLHTSFQQQPLSHGGSEIVSSPKKTRSLMKIMGSGIAAEIKCTPSMMECGTVIIGTSQQRTLTLINPTSSDLHYRLKSSDSVNGQPTSTPSCIELSPSEGVLPAYLQSDIRLTLRPSQCLLYTSTLSYKLITNKPGIAVSETELCRVSMLGAYPTLTVADVQGQGSANLLSKLKLWSMLSIDKINQHLCEEPSSAELRYAIATRHSMRRRVPVHTRAIVDFDFGAATVNSESSTVHLMLENKGDVPTEWAFQFPIDMHLEPEYWAETGELDDVERHELNVLENELFTVHPKTGQLDPGARTTLTVSYKHTHVGTNKLPVLLKINRGREILLNWSGVTVEMGRPYVHIKQTHCFNPVPIGAHAYPRQVFEIHNSGDSGVGYTVDTRPLDDLQATNYLMPILKCLQPQGEIPSGCSVSLEFVFSPLEAKKYTVDLPIHLSSGKTALVNFSGEGYDPKYQNKAPSYVENTSNMPVHGSIAVKEKQAKLSHDSISFGHLPLFAVARRLVFITNSSKHTLSFHWELTSDRAKEVLSVQPADGYIQPETSAACKLTFCSHSSPSCYDLDLICTVMDESKLLSHQTKLEQWQERQEEKKHLFTITQDNLSSGSPGSGSSPATPSRGGKTTSKLKSLSGKKTKHRPRSSDLELRAKYQTLPPIGASPGETCTYQEWKKLDLSVKSKARPRARKDSEDKPPVPPEPLILHLGVLAQTFSIPDYAALHNDLDSFFIDRQSLVGQTPVITADELPVKVTTEEEALLGNVLNQMIRELLEDDNFHAAVKRVVEEPVPYFAQLSSRRPRQSESVQQSAHRHIYAAGLEEDAPLTRLSSHHPLTPSPSHTPQASQSQCLIQSEDGEGEGEGEGEGGEFVEMLTQHRLEEEEEEEEGEGGGGSRVSLMEEMAEDTAETDIKIKHLPEFGSLVEGIVENTILNILKEANCDEFNITAPIYTITKPADLS